MLDPSNFDSLTSDSRSQFRHSAAAISVDDSRARNQPSISGSAEIGKGLVFRGDITGSDDLVIEGKAEGSIHLAGGCVTVGRNGHVTADITAREIIVLGRICGDVTAMNLIDVRAEGAVIGNLLSPSVVIEDGAFIKGAIWIRKGVLRQGSD